MASMAQWVSAWDFLIRGHAVRDVGGGNSGRGVIAGRVFHPTSRLARFSYFVNSKFVRISPPR